MRARNIKPGFFKNDELVECEPLARLLFVGLWCMADRDGRLEDRPKKIKLEILGADDCDIEALLAQLADKKFIIRYEVSGKRFITIPEFVKHQNPHHKEKPSTIPAYVKPQASPGQAQVLPQASPSLTLLNPDSGFLNPDTAAGAASTSSKAEEAVPKSAGETDSGWLARLWLFHLCRARNKDDDRAADRFDEMIRHGVRPAQIEAEIVDKSRKRTEPLWDLEKRLLPSTGPPGRGKPDGPPPDYSDPKVRADIARREAEAIDRKTR